MVSLPISHTLIVLLLLTLTTSLVTAQYLRTPIYTVDTSGYTINQDFSISQNYNIIPDIEGCTFCFLTSVTFDAATIHSFGGAECHVDSTNMMWTIQLSGSYFNYIKCKFYCIYCNSSNITIPTTLTLTPTTNNSIHTTPSATSTSGAARLSLDNTASLLLLLLLLCATHLVTVTIDSW